MDQFVSCMENEPRQSHQHRNPATVQQLHVQRNGLIRNPPQTALHYPESKCTGFCFPPPSDVNESHKATPVDLTEGSDLHLTMKSILQLKEELGQGVCSLLVGGHWCKNSSNYGPYQSLQLHKLMLGCCFGIALLPVTPTQGGSSPTSPSLPGRFV